MKTQFNRSAISYTMLFVFIAFGCKKETKPTIKSDSPKSIMSFVFSKDNNSSLNYNLNTIVDTVAHTVVASVPSNFDVTALKANFQTSPNTTVKVSTDTQISGVTANNFSKTIVYTIVAQDNSKQDYNVTVSILPANLNIYISGFEESDFNASENTVKYWKDGVATSLTNGIHYDYAGNIAVAGSDVYVLGQINDFGYQSSYWKNGKATLLRYGAQQTVGEASGMTSSGGNIYFAGTDSLGNNSGYWKNGIFTNIGTPNSFFPHPITVNGADVYVGGNAIPSGTPCYWKNGTFVNVAVPVNNYVVNGIATNGTDVYLLGMDFVNTKVMCWKNGIVFNLLDANVVNGIAMVGNDVYVVGDTYNNSTSRFVACYWKNGGAAIPLTDGTKDAQATAICVNGSNFFIVGFEASDNSSEPTTVVAKYWINGTGQVSISSGTDVVYPTGIFVQ